MKKKKVMFVCGVVLLVICGLMLLTVAVTEPRGFIYTFVGFLPFTAVGVVLVILGRRKSQPSQTQPSPLVLLDGESAEMRSGVYTLDQEGHITGRADGKPISDGEVSYIVEHNRSATLKEYETTQKKKTKQEKFEDELATQFFIKHGAKTQRMSDAFLDHARLVMQTDDVDERIRLLEETIALFYEARDWHYNYSKGAKLYFQSTWEHCFNSRNPDFCWVENEEAFLRECIFERDQIEPWIIKHADQGFMQPEIYKAFPSVGQGTLRQTIDRLVKLGRIVKSKEGRSYKITISK